MRRKNANIVTHKTNGDNGMGFEQISNSQIRILIHEKYKMERYRSLLIDRFIHGKTYDELLEEQAGGCSLSDFQKRKLKNWIMKICCEFKQYAEHHAIYPDPYLE